MQPTQQQPSTGRQPQPPRAMPPEERLRASLRGDLLDPSHPDYERARKLYNGMIDKRPRLIARCRDVADVIASLELAREQGLLTAIRGGGHNGPGLGSCDDGLVVDLSPMRHVRVDPALRTVEVGGGATWGDVDHATHALGLAVPSGIISTTGVGGLTLGGGHGYLARKYGLTIDNLLSADVVLADGRLVKASADEHQDLFWALRGGGGNFGVVTAFTFKAHPVSSVIGGPSLWDLEHAPLVMRFFDQVMAGASRDLYGFFAFLKVPPAPPFPEPLHLKTMCGIIWCYLGPKEQADEAFAPLRAFQAAAFEHVGELPYPAMQSMFDALYPPGLKWYWRADFVRELSDQAIALHAAHGEQLPTLYSTMHLYPIDGAVHDVGSDETAFAYRDVRYSQVIVGVSPDAADVQPMTRWTRDYFDALHPHAAGGAYVNFMMQEGDARVRATYGRNYDRLVEIKRKYDPDNFFRVNQNIAP